MQFRSVAVLLRAPEKFYFTTYGWPVSNFIKLIYFNKNNIFSSKFRSGPSGAPGATPVNQAKSKYPALLVHPKPQDGQNNFRRSELDQKVKSLLVLTPAKLTEWLYLTHLTFHKKIKTF